MREMIMILALAVVVGNATQVYSASAKCVVVKKEGNVLVIDCGERASGFQENSRVKIKTDRGNG